MKLIRETKLVGILLIAILVSIMAVGISVNNTDGEKRLAKHESILQACNTAFELLFNILEEKSTTEIGINTYQNYNNLYKSINCFKSRNVELLEKINNTLNNSEQIPEIIFLRNAIITALKKLDHSRIINNSYTDRIDTAMVNKWSHTTLNILKDLEIAIKQISAQYKFGYIRNSIADIITNLHLKFIIFYILRHKNMIDELPNVTFSINEQLNLTNRKIQSSTTVDNITIPSQLHDNLKELLKIYNLLQHKLTTGSNLTIDEFRDKIGFIMPCMHFTALLDANTLKQEIPDRYLLVTYLLVLILCLTAATIIILYNRFVIPVIHLKNFTITLNESIPITTSKFGILYTTAIKLRELNDATYQYQSLDVSNIVPIHSLNNNNSSSTPNYNLSKQKDTGVLNICSIVQEINMCNTKIFENISYLRERANSLDFKRKKIAEIAQANLKKNLTTSSEKCLNELESFYSLDSFACTREISSSEFSYVFEKFQELSFKADNVKNIFLELISEIKLLTLNSVISDSSSVNISTKINNILENMVSKISFVKNFSSDAVNTYNKTNMLLSSLVKIAKDLEHIQRTLETKTDHTQQIVGNYFSDFNAIHKHYENIFDNIDNEKTDITNFIKVLNNIKLLIENTNTKVNSMISEVAELSNEQSPTVQQ